MCYNGRLNVGPLNDLSLNGILRNFPLHVLVIPQDPTQMQVPIDAIVRTCYFSTSMSTNPTLLPWTFPLPL